MRLIIDCFRSRSFSILFVRGETFLCGPIRQVRDVCCFSRMGCMRKLHIRAIVRMGNTKKRLFLFITLIIAVLFLFFSVRLESWETILPDFITHLECKKQTAAIANRIDLKSDSENGYVLAASYFDQATGSMANLLSMQCWAGGFGPQVGVVEPFIMHSTFGVNLSEVTTSPHWSDDGNQTKLGDLYSKRKWAAGMVGFASLVSWKYFISDAPRYLIIVNKNCIEPDNPLLCNDCTELIDSLHFNQSARLFANKYGFEVIREICIPGSPIKRAKFKKLVYGPYDPSDVVVLFEWWGGIQQEEYSIRMGITDMKQCNRLSFEDHFTPLNSNITEDAKQYIEKYIPNASTKGYIAVMVRTEYISLLHGDFVGWSKQKILNFFYTKCYSEVLKKVNKMKSKHNIDSVFLTLDCKGKGSYQFENPTELTKTIASTAPTLFQMLYGNSTTLPQWEQSFIDIASLQTPGYVAILQKQLAASSTCLLTVGDGQFQKTAKNMYKKYRACTSKCMEHIKCGP